MCTRERCTVWISPVQRKTTLPLESIDIALYFAYLATLLGFKISTINWYLVFFLSVDKYIHYLIKILKNYFFYSSAMFSWEIMVVCSNIFY